MPNIININLCKYKKNTQRQSQYVYIYILKNECEKKAENKLTKKKYFFIINVCFVVGEKKRESTYDLDSIYKTVERDNL